MITCMANIVQRKVRGKIYYYLERTLRVGKRFRKFSEYIGPKKPAKPGLSKIEKKLDKKIKEFYRQELLKPKTEFIDIKTAKSLEKIKQETAKFLSSLSERQRKEWIEAEREKFITHTNAIEGSTLTLDETRRILRLNERLGGERERLEVLNMEKCLGKYDQYLLAGMEIDEKMILQLHYMLLNEMPDYDKYKGIWRPVNVYIKVSNYEFPGHQYVPSLMGKMLAWYKENNEQLHPVELAAKFHAQLTTIHPFADGNGRMARLLMNYILQSKGLPFTNIPVQKRDEYFDTQEKGHSEHYKDFTIFLAKQMKENYKELKGKIKN